MMHGDIVCLRAHTGKLLRCPLRGMVGRSEEGMMPLAHVDATAHGHGDAQRWEILMC